MLGKSPLVNALEGSCPFCIRGEETNHLSGYDRRYVIWICSKSKVSGDRPCSTLEKVVCGLLRQEE